MLLEHKTKNRFQKDDTSRMRFTTTDHESLVVIPTATDQFIEIRFPNGKIVQIDVSTENDEILTILPGDKQTIFLTAQNRNHDSLPLVMAKHKRQYADVAVELDLPIGEKTIFVRGHATDQILPKAS